MMSHGVLVQVMTFRLLGTKLLPEPMLIYCQLGPKEQNLKYWKI